MTGRQEMVDRWLTPEGEELARWALSALLDPDGELDALPLPRHDGRLDLRGIRIGGGPGSLAGVSAGGLAVEEVSELREVRACEWKGIDFSGGVLADFRFMDSRIEDCRFTDARCKDWRAWNLRVTDTSFEGAILQDCHLGTWNEGKVTAFRRVDLSRADLKTSFFSYSQFEGCDFSGADVDGLDFRSAHFTKCRFAGDLNGTIFWFLPPRSDSVEPNPMDRVDMSACMLRFVEFRGLDLKGVSLPEGSQYIRVSCYPCVMRTAPERLRLLPGKNGKRAAALLERQSRWINPERDAGIWHESDLARSEEESEMIRAVFRSCEEACGAKP
ncbi:pentapeptide repeat-containing protein [Streptomyces sp. I05A-00742]|uniref:pentapeptide repeat-containing protein n=1 Tax=Streptomyces sp. I05A-00742 TaxID=2732853 RepID=UPI001488F7B3|nr:pentapeptide repeat-containing protein [Streptomyces sp. I05A-00742]